MSGPASDVTNWSRPHRIVRAGAGAGKTTALIAEILEAAADFRRANGRFPSLVVTTFTRKATQEIRERLMRKVCEAHPELMDFVLSRSLLQVSTIHGILNIFLQRHGQQMGIDPGFAIVEGPQEQKLFKSVLREVLLAEADGFELLEKYDFAHLSAYVRDYFHLWLTYPDLRSQDEKSFLDIADLYARAWSERGEELARSLRAETQDEKWTDFARILQTAAQILKNDPYPQARRKLLPLFENGKPRHMKNNPKVSDETDEAVKEFWGELKKIEGTKAEDLHWNPEQWPSFTARFRQFQAVADRFCGEFYKRKIDSGQFTIADLESVSLRLMREKPEAARTFSEEWDYWLIDEYQDTSPVQVEILKGLIGEKASYIVGDPQQSIYLFRGARSEVFAQREKAVRGIEGGRSGELMRNYRSEPPLLLFFNDFFASMSSQFKKMEPKEAPSSEKPEVARFAVLSEELNEEGIPNEYLAVTRRIDDLLREGVRPDQICLIARTNRLLDEFSAYLTQCGYPVHVHVSSGFYKRREVRDALAILKFLANPYDDLNLFSLLRSPWFRVDDEALARAGVERTGSLWAHLQSGPTKDLPAIRYLREQFLLCEKLGYCQSLGRMLKDCGLLEWSLHADPTGRREANLWKLLSQLHEQERQSGFNVLQFIGRQEGEVKLEEAESEADAVTAVEPNRINLMTVHGSKGLQFDHVLLPGLHKSPLLSKKEGLCFDEENRRWSLPFFDEESQGFLYSLADLRVTERMREAELLEQERLFYVAMTRARKTVFLSWLQPEKRNSPASLFRWDFSQDEVAASFYRYRVERGPWEKRVYQSKEKSPAAPPPPWTPPRACEAPKTVSVSRLLESWAKENANGGFPAEKNIEYLADRAQKARSGVLMHRIFEIMNYGKVDDDLVKRFFPKEQQGAVKEAMIFAQGLAAPPMKELLARGKSEWGFLARIGKNLVEGQIDLWGEAEGRLWIVDYKTGDSRYSERAFQQLALYAQALLKKYPGASVKLAVLYPFEKSVKVRDLSEMAGFLREMGV